MSVFFLQEFSFAFSDSEEESDKEEEIQEEIQRTKDEIQKNKDKIQKNEEELQKTKDEIQSIIVDEKDEIERNLVGICVICEEELKGDGIPYDYQFKKAGFDVRGEGKMCVECSLIEAEEEGM